MLPTEANDPNALVAVPDRFTIYSPTNQCFASRHSNGSIRIIKGVVDEYCYMTLIEHVPGTNKIRFSLDTGAVVFRHSDNGNLHSRGNATTNPDTLFELFPRPDGTFLIKADDGLYVSVYHSSDYVLRSSKREPDQWCIFVLETRTTLGSSDDIKKVSNDAEVA